MHCMEGIVCDDASRMLWHDMSHFAGYWRASPFGIPNLSADFIDNADCALYKAEGHCGIPLTKQVVHCREGKEVRNNSDKAGCAL